MANIQSHMQQWEHNRSLLAHVPGDYPDWLATISFYTALQAIDALLAYDNVPANSHDTVNASSHDLPCYWSLWASRSRAEMPQKVIRNALIWTARENPEAVDRRLSLSFRN